MPFRSRVPAVKFIWCPEPAKSTGLNRVSVPADLFTVNSPVFIEALACLVIFCNPEPLTVMAVVPPSAQTPLPAQL